MLKVLGVIVLVLAAGIAGVCAYAAVFQPDTFRVQRTARIVAPPEKIYPLVSDLHRMAEWSPYEKKDPDMKRSYGGAASGQGAVYSWDGDSNVGAGNIEVASLSPPSKVVMSLNMVRPFAAHNVIEFTLEPRDQATAVTWALHGPMPFVSKVMCLFFDMDKMIGGDMDTGLASLKTLAEK
jgi:uncharacterized protein YndB with AHSA1/START domain